MTQSRHAKIPATIVTGFLGAGKTSLIRNLLESANGQRLAIIVNEFGDIGVDGELLAECGSEACGEDDIIELANGCICCTVVDDFLPAMTALLERDQPPEHIIVETSGLALPKPLVRAFGWPEVRTRVTVDGVIAVVDCHAVAEGRFADDVDALDHDAPLAELFVDQLACADLVILNKTDLVADATMHAVCGKVEAGVRGGAVKVVPAVSAIVPAQVVFGIGAAAENDLDARPSHHDDEGEHDHDDFNSFHVALGPVISPQALTDRLRIIAAAHDIYRIKGFVAVDGRDMRLVVQGVGDRFQHYYDRDWTPDEVRQGQFVVIGAQGMDRDAISAAIRA